MKIDGFSLVETHEACEGCPAGLARREWQEEQRCQWISPRLWMDPGCHRAAVMGQPRDLESGDSHPIEPNEDGCPGSWYRCDFVYSLHRYLRPCAEGVYSPNLSLDRSPDRLVVDATSYFELEQGRWRAWVAEKTRPT